MAELALEDFSFTGRLGSQGATIARVSRNHFRVGLGSPPGHPEWFNLLQFEIMRNARGNALRLDVAFASQGETRPNIRFNHDASTWSYDGRNWMPIAWQRGPKNGGETEDTLLFPEFTGDRVYFGAQVPMAYEDVVAFMEQYGRHPDATVHVIGQSLGGRNIYRLEITDRHEEVQESQEGVNRRSQRKPRTEEAPLRSLRPSVQDIPRSRRWGFHVNQQHTGEHHGKWRMIGMIDWLLSEAGADFRRRSVWHFVLEMNPDGASNGWYRVNAQGVDLNRAYLIAGADPAGQAHESYILQKDFEALMASETPITAYWSMHTWPDEAQPFMYPGPEVGNAVGPASAMGALLDRMDPNQLIKPLTVEDKQKGPTICWHNGPHQQFGITGFLCEGSDYWTDKNLSLEVGEVFIRAMAEYYSMVPDAVDGTVARTRG